MLNEIKDVTQYETGKHRRWFHDDYFDLYTCIALGLLLTLATALVQPLGVSAQFVVTDAMIAKQVAPELVEHNVYLSQTAEAENWGASYAWMLVFGMLVGGGVTSLAFRTRQPNADKGSMPPMWQSRFGPSKSKRYLAASTLTTAQYTSKLPQTQTITMCL